MEEVFHYSTVFSIAPVSQSNLLAHLFGHLSGYGNHDPAADFVRAFTPDHSFFFERGNQEAYLTFTQSKMLCHVRDVRWEPDFSSARRRLSDEGLIEVLCCSTLAFFRASRIISSMNSRKTVELPCVLAVFSAT